MLTAIELAARLGHDDEITAFWLAGADTTAWRNHYTSMPDSQRLLTFLPPRQFTWLLTAENWP